MNGKNVIFCCRRSSYFSEGAVEIGCSTCLIYSTTPIMCPSFEIIWTQSKIWLIFLWPSLERPYIVLLNLLRPPILDIPKLHLRQLCRDITQLQTWTAARVVCFSSTTFEAVISKQTCVSQLAILFVTTKWALLNLTCLKEKKPHNF